VTNKEQALQDDLKQSGKHRKRIMEYNSRITSKGICIKFSSLNLYMLVDTLVLIVWMC